MANLLVAALLLGAGTAQAQVAPQTVREDGFPQLPQSHVCTAKDVLGVWYLRAVFEVPAGSDKADFEARPYQGLNFEANSVVHDVRLPKVAAAPVPDGEQQAVMQSLLQLRAALGNVNLPKPLTQYALLDSGLIYYYTDSQVAGSHACFVTDAALPPIAAGQLLLMAPAPEGGAPKVKLARIYDRAPPEPRAVAPVAPAPAMSQPALRPVNPSSVSVRMPPMPTPPAAR